ncbi:hypothetical protein J0S82_015831, partial [Galemys pyrenaicus]
MEDSNEISSLETVEYNTVPSFVLTQSTEQKSTVTSQAQWSDFDDDYKTVLSTIHGSVGMQLPFQSSNLYTNPRIFTNFNICNFPFGGRLKTYMQYVKINDVVRGKLFIFMETWLSVFYRL